MWLYPPRRHLVKTRNLTPALFAAFIEFCPCIVSFTSPANASVTKNALSAPINATANEAASFRSPLIAFAPRSVSFRAEEDSGFRVRYRSVKVGDASGDSSNCDKALPPCFPVAPTIRILLAFSISEMGRKMCMRLWG